VESSNSGGGNKKFQHLEVELESSQSGGDNSLSNEEFRTRQPDECKTSTSVVKLEVSHLLRFVCVL
jgi:hypothetical protein